MPRERRTGILNFGRSLLSYPVLLPAVYLLRFLFRDNAKGAHAFRSGYSK